MKKIFVFVGFGLLLGCGFHLRGIEHMPPEIRSVYIDTPYQNTVLVLKLREQLSNNGVKLASSPDQAISILTISPLGIDDQTISLLGSGAALTHRLTESVNYSLKISGTNQLLLPEQTARASQTYNSNASLILTDNYQVKILGERLQGQLALDIFSVLTRVKKDESTAS